MCSYKNLKPVSRTKECSGREGRGCGCCRKHSTNICRVCLWSTECKLVVVLFPARTKEAETQPASDHRATVKQLRGSISPVRSNEIKRHGVGPWFSFSQLSETVLGVCLLPTPVFSVLLLLIFMMSIRVWDRVSVPNTFWQVAAHASNPRTQEARAGGSLWVQGQSRLQNESIAWVIENETPFRE